MSREQIVGHLPEFPGESLIPTQLADSANDESVSRKASRCPYSTFTRGKCLTWRPARCNFGHQLGGQR